MNNNVGIKFAVKIIINKISLKDILFKEIFDTLRYCDQIYFVQRYLSFRTKILCHYDNMAPPRTTRRTRQSTVLLTHTHTRRSSSACLSFAGSQRSRRSLLSPPRMAKLDIIYRRRRLRHVRAAAHLNYVYDEPLALS